MPKMRLVVHIAEPFDFERGNGGVADLEGWTAQATPAFSDWVVHLDHPAIVTIDESVGAAADPPVVAGDEPDPLR